MTKCRPRGQEGLVPGSTNRCFVDEEILNEHGAGILRALFKNENQEQVVVHVPIAEFYELHNLNEDNMELWEHMNHM